MKCSCLCVCESVYAHVHVCVLSFISLAEGSPAVKGFEKCDFELLHVGSQFDQCLLQLLLASGHSEPLINEFLSVSPWTDV